MRSAASTRKPGAEPRAFGRTTAPSITSACFSFTFGISQPRRRNRSRRRREDLLVADERATHDRREDLLRPVVGRRAEAPRDDEKRRAAEGEAHLRLQLRPLVAHAGLPDDLDPHRLQLAGQEERVRVEARRPEKLAPDGEDRGGALRRGSVLIRRAPPPRASARAPPTPPSSPKDDFFLLSISDRTDANLSPSRLTEGSAKDSSKSGDRPSRGRESPPPASRRGRDPSGAAARRRAGRFAPGWPVSRVADRSAAREARP